MANQKHYQRRSFLQYSLTLGTGTMLLNRPLSATGLNFPQRKKMTVDEVVKMIIKEIPGAPFAQTVDTYKSGDGSNDVTGIVTTMFATVDIIEKTAAAGANFIIAHEPTFYNHTDDPQWAGKNSVVVKKQELLKKHGITVWRFHDYWHAHRPDGVYYGVIKKLGWEKFTDIETRKIKLPAQSLLQLANDLKKKLSISHIRVIGDLSQSVSNIALIPGAAGGQTQMRVAEQSQPDVLIVGELHEWETAEYVRDARALGEKKALIILGHPVSEEPGMSWLVEWLKPRVPGITVTHIATPDPFTWL